MLIAITALFATVASALPALSPYPTKSSFNFNVAAPATKSPVHVAIEKPEYVSIESLRMMVPGLKVGQSLDDIVDVNQLFSVDALHSKRSATATCLDSSTTDVIINSILYHGGKNTVISLCPRAQISLKNAIQFTAPGQELSTQGQ